ncbi:MAG TPA: nucleotidyltransferase domain-containing protein [Minicystis sp.]|nr:nucleotidyltransferase domain-containing protein [Minicystis sp.]
MFEPETLVARVARALSGVPGVRVAFVFGSRVTRRARPDSDLDVGVVYARELDGRGREDARRDVCDALAAELGALGERADVVDLDRCGAAIAFAALRDGCLALARTEPERVAFAVRTMRRYDDDAPRRALFREAARRVASRGAVGRS